MISGRVIAENDLVYVFKSVDNKYPTTVKKASKVEKVFDSDSSIDDVFTWIESVRVKK